MSEPEPSDEGKSAAQGVKAWVPVIAVLGAMPLVSYLITAFVLLPKIEARLQPSDHASAAAEAPKAAEKKKSGHGKSGHGHDAGPADGESMAMVSKVLVNVKNTGATRYLVTSFALIGSDPRLKDAVKEREPQLRDLAMGILMDLSIEDLAQSDIKNRVKAAMIASFNNAFGDQMVDNVFFTEFAVQ